MTRERTGTRSRSSTARTSTPPSSACRRASVPTVRASIRARSTAFWCWSSTTRTTSTGRTTRGRRPRALLVLLDLLREVVAFAGLRDQGHLGFDPVRVALLALQDVLEQLPAAVVAQAPGGLDPSVEHADGVALELQIQTELLRHGLADVHLAEPLHVGHALEVEDALDQLIGVAHLTNRFLAELLPQPLVAPVLAHPAVDEILIDRRELGREDLVQEGDDLLVASHSAPPISRLDWDARHYRTRRGLHQAEHRASTHSHRNPSRRRRSRPGARGCRRPGRSSPGSRVRRVRGRDRRSCRRCSYL